MATLATLQDGAKNNQRIYAGGVGVNDNDIVVDAKDLRDFDTFQVMTTAGAVDVEVSLDGTNYTTAISLQDFGATDNNPVLVTAASRQYAFRGIYQGIRVRQNGATAAEDVCLVCSRLGGR